jgi:hypothetical protein
LGSFRSCGESEAARALDQAGGDLADDYRDPLRVRQRIFLVDGNKQQITAINSHTEGPGSLRCSGRKLRCCPWRAGQLVKAIHVLQIHETSVG